MARSGVISLGEIAETLHMLTARWLVFTAGEVAVSACVRFPMIAGWALDGVMFPLPDTCAFGKPVKTQLTPPPPVKASVPPKPTLKKPFDSCWIRIDVETVPPFSVQAEAGAPSISTPPDIPCTPLNVDVGHLTRQLEQFWLDKMDVITNVFSRIVTETISN